MSVIKFNKTSAEENANNAMQVQILQDDEFQDRVPSSDLRSSDTYKTPFGSINIEKFTQIHIAVLLAFATVMMYETLSTHYYVSFVHFFVFHSTEPVIVRQVLTILGSLLMIMARKKRLPLLYLPFLIANGLWILYATFAILWTIGIELQTTDGKYRTFFDFLEQMLFYGYMEVVFFKAYKYMNRSA
ncbi:hypothetical protein Ddc_12020 [Ditylenchus destructor]|nr:hypothetical protein Ddc_12020 [Ditylenchus destructor]